MLRPVCDHPHGIERSHCPNGCGATFPPERLQKVVIYLLKKAGFTNPCHFYYETILEEAYDMHHMLVCCSSTPQPNFVIHKLIGWHEYYLQKERDELDRCKKLLKNSSTRIKTLRSGNLPEDLSQSQMLGVLRKGTAAYEYVRLVGPTVEQPCISVKEEEMDVKEVVKLIECEEAELEQILCEARMHKKRVDELDVPPHHWGLEDL